MSDSHMHRVVVIGGGFGGLAAVQSLRHKPVDVTLIDRRNFHLFQPLTYQVATGALAPSEIAYPLRAMFKRDDNVRVILADASGFDLDARTVQLKPAGEIPAPASIPYDTLIVAGGSHYSYFGHDDWRGVAAEVKSLESATKVRGRILSAFEAAELETDPERRAAWLTFAVVGAGPTGVEMAGQIAELGRSTLRSDFDAIAPSEHCRILLIEAQDRILTSFPSPLSTKAQRSLERLGVSTLLSTTVIGVDAAAITVDARRGEPERIPTHTVIWAAGVAASELARKLGELTGAEIDAVGRVTVEADLTLPRHPEVFAIGDMVRVRQQDHEVRAFPGVAPVAMQQGRHAARSIVDQLGGRTQRPFRYVDKGNLATIGRGAAVADIRGLKLSGFIAWLTWLMVHLWYLVGFRNRLLVFTDWALSFVTRGRGTRLITEPSVSDPQDDE